MDAGPVIRYEFKNKSPVEIEDFANSLLAFSSAFSDFSDEFDRVSRPANARLYIKKIESGSIVADLVSFVDQLSFLYEHRDVLSAFVVNISDLVNYFIGISTANPVRPTQREARQLSTILEPVSKDNSSQLNIYAMEGGTVVVNNFNINSINANAAQNAIRRFVGPELPTQYELTDQLMILEQVKNDASARTGDRGIIEAVSPKAVKLQFTSDDIKRRILDIHENPLKCAFLVNVEVRTVSGKVALYRVREVTEVINIER